MAKLLKLRRGTTTQHGSFTGAEGEVTVDTDKDTLVVHDGSTAGGHPVAAEDMANVSSANIAGRLANDSIAVGKIAAGTLPSDVKIVDANVSGNLTIESADIVDGTIVNADISATAGIAGTKLENSGVTAGQYGSSSAIPIVTVDAQGLVTAASTTAIDSTTIANGSSSVSVANNGAITSNANHDFDSGIDVTGNITVTGTVDGVDVAALKTSKDSLSTTNGALVNGVTATTQSASDNSTKVATTAYTDTAISNLVDSSPGALNTLNELAAAIGDDANFSTTVTNNIASKLPLSGGTITGGVDLSHDTTDVLDFTASSTNNSRGISFNGKTALSAGNDNWIRLNQSSEFTSGVYTPGLMRADGGYQVDGATVINDTGYLIAGRLTGALPAIDGSNLTGISAFVSGMIMLWSGSAGSIPSGWRLCDGNNSTPNLQNRFIIGAGNSYNPGNTGGSTTDTISMSVSGSDTVSFNTTLYSDGLVYHYYTGGAYNYHTIAVRVNNGYGTQRSRTQTSLNVSDTVNISASGSATVDTVPPYYALCYIMKT